MVQYKQQSFITRMFYNIAKKHKAVRGHELLFIRASHLVLTYYISLEIISVNHEFLGNKANIRKLLDLQSYL